MENIICKTTPLGKVYVNYKTGKMMMKVDGKTLRSVEIMDYFLENRTMIKSTIEITKFCNFNCYYCYADDRHTYDNDLKTDEIYSLVDQLSEMGTIFLTLTGGEVFSRKDISEILDYIKKKKMIVSIFSNGYYLNSEKIIRSLENSYLQELNISLLSPYEEIFDKMVCFKGAFKRVVENVKHLREKNIPVKFLTSITKANVDSIKDLKKLSKTLNVPISYKYDVLPTYLSDGNVENYQLDLDDVYKIAEIYTDREHFDFKVGRNTCGPGKYKLSIDSAGNIFPCRDCRINVGNIRNETLKTIWNSDKIKNASNTIVNGKNVIKMDMCNKCELEDYCFYCPGVKERHANKKNACNHAMLMKKLEEVILFERGK